MEYEREDGQALPLALGASLALIAAALALVAIAGAVTGKGRVQRAADLAAISAARSMRDDLPRLLAPARLPDGSLDPRHLNKAAYLARARAAALEAARRNGVAPERVRVSFPDVASFAPVRVKAVVVANLDVGTGHTRVEASAVAEAASASGATESTPATASGGGYDGPLAYRQGEGMRPDVAAAFDRMAAAAARAGLALVVNSGFRSDAEQAALFAAHPDPRWVAPPGRSLHRCATELDLGPPSAYGWLATNARRFGFLQRYSWEAWHYGFVAGPPPCSRAGDSVGAGGGGDGAVAGAGGLPSFVPARFRAPLLRAAARWNVSAALLAAQLMAESNFDPYAGSPAGAQGIAQFIPSTAAAYGLRDPFDPDEAIDAQGHLMSDLIRRFGSPQLALAAYNAGPAPVEACHCVPPYPETQAYVTRILALLDGSGTFAAPSFEVRLVA
ncbi:MAG: lytic transglycosylase domain-containing protein [Chloroflexota bacterium]